MCAKQKVQLDLQQLIQTHPSFFQPSQSCWTCQFLYPKNSEANEKLNKTPKQLSAVALKFQNLQEIACSGVLRLLQLQTHQTCLFAKNRSPFRVFSGEFYGIFLNVFTEHLRATGSIKINTRPTSRPTFVLYVNLENSCQLTFTCSKLAIETRH